MNVRTVMESDAADWERMRQEFWPGPPGEHAQVIAAFFAGDRRSPAETFIALDQSGRAVGFAGVAIRPYAEGCSFGRVGYLEGWFVEAQFRRRGTGSALVKAAEAWGRTQGCREFGSDAELNNRESAEAHRALGFEETGRIICFRKTL